MISRRHFAAGLLTSISLLLVTAPAAQAQTKVCVIASNDGRNGLRTDEISQCRINVGNGNASFVMNGERRQRSYAGRHPLTTHHLEMASFWLNPA